MIQSLGSVSHGLGVEGEIMKILPTITSAMWHPPPELRLRWLREYGKDRFTFEEARRAQTFPSWWKFPNTKSRKWKWLAEAFPPKVAQHLFTNYVKHNNNILLDIFAGIGGWGLGATLSGKFSKIIMVEYDKSKCNFLNINFSQLEIEYEIICEDIRNLDFSIFSNIDVVTVSPPCEDLSILRYFSRNSRANKGTVPLTLLAIEVVNTIKPRISFYENVYRRILVDILRKHGWYTLRFNMSKIIPQKRIRLIGIKFLENSFSLPIKAY